ncbi:septum formation family protein [Antribacter sp. KLBMP9083]|uniref:Septum formation family protein n=1 Tax=Antribacter soli TaxID=2910976 RepID=A0AA41QFS1_9MICO|nr:septum formation family protein [Antribacter soli]MCF4122650.1 septum formation family protein [Antribacter soli]
MSDPELAPFAPPSGSSPIPVPVPVPVSVPVPERRGGYLWALIAGAIILTTVIVGGVVWSAWTLAQHVVAEGLLPLADDVVSEDDEDDEDVPVLRTVYPVELRVEDCFDSRGMDFDAESYTIDIVACANPHTSDVYADVTLPEGEFPGDRALDLLAEDYCTEELDALEAYYGGDMEVSAWWYWPLEESWTFDADRVITCVAETDYEFIEGPLYYPGILDEMTSYAALRPGDCFDSDEQEPSGASAVLVPVRPCERFHLSEAFAQVPLPSEEFPGDARKELLGDEACRAEYERLGLGAGDGTLVVGSISPGRDQWGRSSFDVVACYVESSETLLQGSIVDGSQV